MALERVWKLVRCPWMVPMADYYQYLSHTIPELTETEVEWWKKYLDGDIKIEWSEGCDAENHEDDYGVVLPCRIEWEADDSIWICAEDYVNLDVLCEIVHKFLVDTVSDKVITMEWANGCSKPREDGFGGGAFLVSKRGWVFMNTGQWMLDLEKWFDKTYDPAKEGKVDFTKFPGIIGAQIEGG